MADTHLAEVLHPAAPHHLPVYIPGPDGSDPLFTGVVVGIIVLFMTIGVLYFKLHSLPEHLGLKHNSTQLLLISVLAILALFTHNNTFWVLALLIAVVRFPDFMTPLQSIADSLEKMSAAEKEKGGNVAMTPPEPVAESGHDTSPSDPLEESSTTLSADTSSREG